MFNKNLITFFKRNVKYKRRFAEFAVTENFDELEPDRILEILCEFLMRSECTEDVADCFPELLPALISMAISSDDIRSSALIHMDIIHKLNSVVLGKLIAINQDLLTFVLRYFDVNPAPFESPETKLTTLPPAKKQNTKKLSYFNSKISDYEIVTATYNILQSAVNHFKHKWNWSKFYKYLTNEDDKVKWVAFKCIAIVLNMSESTRLSYIHTFITNSKEFLTSHEGNKSDTRVACENFESIKDMVKDVSSVISVGDILLPTCQNSNEKNACNNLVQVPSTMSNLQSLAIAIGSRKCICLQGPVGCGKTALVEYLARMTGHNASNFLKVQLGDQTDSKMLLGMYRCTAMPGEFVWQPGILTQAVIAGKWLLLEDIDSAPLDVASVLSNLMETGTLCVPGYRDTIYANSEFQLFVTQRLTTTAQRHITGSSNLLRKHWLCIDVQPLSKEELVVIVKTLFPVLDTAATKIVDVFLLFSVGDHDNEDNSEILSLKSGRQTSTRDLIKWCSRAVVDYDVSSSDSALKILQDAIDVFCCSVIDREQRLNLAISVAHKLGIVKTKAEYFCNIHKPAVTLLPEVLIAGRAKLPRKKGYAEMESNRTNFSFTRPSACLLQRIASCVAQKEPVLLVGETGTGKTSTIQYLAKSTKHKLTVINMNQQSESTDLLGGYKPVDLKFLISPIQQEFDILFRSYFIVEQNKEFLEQLSLLYKQQKWKTFLQLMRHSARAAVKRLQEKCETVSQDDATEKVARKRPNAGGSAPEKDQSDRFNVDMWKKWESLLEKLNKLYTQVKSQYTLAFSFVESSLVKALRVGSWVLLDEINLANAETLECLSGLLESSTESLPLLERGDGEPVKRHPDFMLFACMNPATDVGKRDLPVGLRNRFTEFYVDELTEQIDLLLLVNSYLKEAKMEKHEAIVKFYLSVRKEATSTLFDGTAHQPHYSLRTLCRALSISASNPCGNILRSLFEAFSLSFLTQLDYKSHPIVQKMIAKAILGKDIKATLGTPIPKPKCSPGEEYVNVEGYWVLQGSLKPETPNNYILTDSVRRNLRDLVRVVSIGKLPVLLQGDTSVGKTSLITYLAKISGHVCVRINNHEHTDLQEYVGSYVADEMGKLVFKEGVLVDAMRKGYWIILDELNLAPSDVLEALNRVLDDNRELFISETQQVVKAHEHFMLFATQNPPGIYGGRKVLSRAFRNRFVELHFDEIPANELQIILGKRCNMPESYCKEVISVMTELQIRRKSTAAFAGKKGFITLRDLFRWGERYRLVPNVGNSLYDWRQHLVEEGYLVLAAKVRKAEEADEIRQVMKKHLKRDVDPNVLFTLNDKTSPVTRNILEEILNNDIPGFGHIVWTYHMRRMAVLVKKSYQFKEPVLLVGETGGGKTTVCQLIAAINGQTMRCVNCHMHTESSDFLGNLRPVREHAENDKRLFEWVDGPLINAMLNGDLFLADEISLADDSVLERLNSLLEPERSLLLAEKGIETSHNEESTVIVADEKFMFVGTMNPGGDYGKKELSPALRNRFTEVWCEGCAVRGDLHEIIVHNLRTESHATRESVADAILKFTEWLQTTEVGKKLTVSVRDMLTWVNFINVCTASPPSSTLTIGDAYYHGACLTYIDSLGSGSTGAESIEKLKNFTEAAIRFVRSEVKHTIKSDLNTEAFATKEETVDSDNVFGIPPFYIEKGPHAYHDNRAFTFSTPTTKLNTLKLLRALQLSKPILLEGSPGVGKTSLVSALAKAAGHTLLRINLSDQTDVSDLFGADLPVEGGSGGEFAWRDGPFLRALRAGYWILLDELNLASQSVLEGLNACFDHRGEIYIPELGKTFSVKPGTRLFGCQNPLQQGGARRGLPRSFLNRFTQISVDALLEDDLRFIIGVQFSQLSASLINDMVRFNGVLASEVGVIWGHAGSPWEMNLRDITRWCETTIEAACNELRGDKECFNPGDSVELIYVDRMRTKEDRQKVYHIYQEIFSLEKYPLPPNQLPMHITADKLFVGEVTLSRRNCSAHDEGNLLLLRDQKMALKSLIQCVKMNWMSILVGASGCGKSNVVRLLAALTGQQLRSIAVNSAMDTTEILGGFEQTDYNRHLEQLFERVSTLLIDSLRTKITRDKLEPVAELHGRLEEVRRLFNENVTGRTMAAETQLFLRKVQELSDLATVLEIWEPNLVPELRDIQSRLANLSVLVKQDKCLNAGGKFEWVDSVLVKCLQDGTWLLIDQVNLCSPAVLDRLNGLLEPNGVLSIGERGVDNDGNVVTIRPHENFRLFLTMDPRYGEISRAMRNRGVEIYMLGPREKVDHDAIDLESLLLNAGIARRARRDALLAIYNRMSQETIAVDRLSAVDLLHTAFLARQRSLRGFPAERSIRDACVDVYVKARSTRDRQHREHLVSLIDEVIEQLLSSHDEELSPIDVDAATWSVKNLQDNSALTVIRQQGLLLNAAVKILSTPGEINTEGDHVTTKALNVFCGFKEDDEAALDVDVKDVLSHFLLNFYEQSSRSDVSLRKDWISKTLRGSGTIGELERENALMAREIAAFRFRSTDPSDSLPWDQWWLVGKAVEDETVGYDANKLTLLLYASTAILGENDAAGVKEAKDRNLISIREYSDAVRHGKLLSQLKNQPLVTHFVEFLRGTRSCIDAILHDDNLKINSDEHVDLRRHLRWFTRFEKLGEATLVDKSRKSRDTFVDLRQTSTLLRVHYKWLLKFLRKLCRMSGKFAPCQETASEVESLTRLTDDLNDRLELIYDPVQKLSKRVKKYLTLPPPHASDTSMNVYSELGKVTRDLDTRDKTGGTLKRELKVACVQLKDAPAMRLQTISLWNDYHSGKAADEATLETVLTVKLFCDESHICLRTPAEIESVYERVGSLSAAEVTRLNARAQLWPIYEYVFLSLVSSLQGRICLEEETVSATSVEQCLARYADVPSIPSDLMGLLNAITRREVEEKRKTLLLPQLFYLFSQFAQRSYAVQDSSLLLQWSGVTEREDLNENSLTGYAAPKTECYFNGPVLLNLILRLLLSKTEREEDKSVLSAVALGTYAAQTDQLWLLNEILWRNSVSLTRNSAGDDLVASKYHSSLCLAAIDRMNSEHDVADLIASVLKKQGGKRRIDVERELQTDCFEPMAELRKAYDEISDLDERVADEVESTIRRGRAWMLLGYVQCLLFGSLDPIDPVHKVELKLKYLEEDIADCDRTVYVARLQSRVLGVNAIAHPRLVATRSCGETLAKTRDELSCLKAFRPPSVDFASLSEACVNFRDSVGAYKLVKKHANNLCAIAREIDNKYHKSNIYARAENALQEAQVWSLSIQGFAEQLEANYQAAYPDVVLPLLTGLAQLKHGVCVLVNETRRLMSLHRNKHESVSLDSQIYNLIRFPTIGPEQESLVELSNRCADRNARLLIDRNSRLDAFFRMQEQFRILKSGLRELHNHAILARGLTKSLYLDVNDLLRQTVLIWKQQQQEEETRAAEKDSLYQNKTENYGDELTEEQELALEVRRLFPTHRDTDFRDMDDEPSLERRDAPPESEEAENLKGFISKDDIREIQRIHSDMVTSLVASKWMYHEAASTSANYIEPLIQRYDTVHSMLDNVLPALSERLAIKLYSSLNLLVSLRLQASREGDSERERTYDFYKDGNVEEAKQCLPVCEGILNRVDQLLEEWPAHPTLKSIRTIIERIYAFPVSSAVSRFLTGLELLLVKMHQWEENAHSGVSMADHVSTLTQQIISWRKLELSCWKNCLDATFNDLKSDTSKWWFFLYALVESYKINEDDVEGGADEPITREKLVESLERFMNESSLVEFEPRLELLLTFHCHVYHLQDSDGRKELEAVLWNVYKYYTQFVDDVRARIAALKTPIEKKLRDFVKIARWNDINYWAVKETVEKTHRTLYKFVKEFRNVLKQNVSCCLTVRSGSYSAELSKGIWDDQDHRKYSINPADFAVTKPPRFVDARTLTASKLVTRAEALRAKATKLCKEIILVSSYPCVRSEVENFIEDFLEQSARLRDMDVDRSLPKSKQKSQAKSILQQKRMTLANYFKALTHLGVSYRAGMLTLKNKADQVMDLTVSPVDLSVIERYFKLKNIDRHTLTQWHGCDKYYYKSFIRLNALNAMLNSNRTDLGPQNMERCRGYSAHIMLMAHRQKATIARSFDYFSSLHTLLSNLSETSEEDLSARSQHVGRECVVNLKTLLVTLEAGFEQLSLFLQCCPANVDLVDPGRAALTLDANALAIIAASQDDEVWRNANALLKDCLGSVKAIATRFRASFVPLEVLTTEYGTLVSSKQLQFLKQCRFTIEGLRERYGQLRQLFENADVAHPISENLAFLDERMEDFVKIACKLDCLQESTELEGEEQPTEDDEAIRQYESALEHLVNTTLLVIQRKYKDHTNLDDVAATSEEPRRENEANDNDDANEEEIEEGRLKKILVEALEQDVTELKLPNIFELFIHLLQSTEKLDPRSANHCIRLLLKCLPLLEQYILLVQFYLNEQVASFRVTCKMLYLQLNVFLDLAANGFCVPKDLDLEEGETDESGQKTDKGGMGLAEGEGTKDVSDRIESEDQLEDAKPADQEQEKQEDKNCKEEEKGINMSEDFDSKLQDMEKGDDDEEQSDDDEEKDLDKEMGETGEDAEQLDKEIWGDDKEESSEEDNQQKDEDEEGTGEQIGEKEMGAKDDKDKSRQNDDDNGADRDEDRREEERKEINELNEPEIDEDQIDPYHGKQQPEPEPEPFDLPDDLNLDEDGKEENGGEEENPFDIDEMKDSKPPPEKMDVDLEEEAEKNEENDPGENTSEDEDENGEKVDKEGQQQDTEDLEADKEEDGQDNKEGIETANKDDEEQTQEEEAKEEDLLEKAAPSADDASSQVDAAQQTDEAKEGSRDAVAEASNNQDQQEASAENTQEKKDDKTGTGQSQSAQQESGHSGSSEQKITPISQKDSVTKPIEKRKNPGESNEDRSLVDKLEPTPKKLRTIYTPEEVSSNEKENELDNADDNKADMCQHVKDSEAFDDYTMDAATEEQVKQQASDAKEDEENHEEQEHDNTMDVEMREEDEENIVDDQVMEQRSEKVSQAKDDKQKKDSNRGENNIENNQMDTMVELEGETVATVTVQRGNESTFHTTMTIWEDNELGSGHMERKRFQVEKMLGEWKQKPTTEEAATAWNCLCSVTDTAARDLSEKLRLVLEPTQASRLKGDYKTGKRINMRKIIPYIASQFRKDKIWLRRTKPSKRDYRIVLALDDSKSMANNHAQEMAFESLSLICKAMTYLEVGRLGVVSFGEQIEMLHPLEETFTEQSGARLIQEMRFDQKSTKFAEVVDFTVDMFESQHTSFDNAKLLIILSDGMGIFSIGTERVNRAVRRARLANIFTVFIILDNPTNKHSILDIRQPVFDGNKLLEFRSCMDDFPFPFYMIVRDINTLPSVLSDALRQWFEVVGKTDT